MMVGNRDFKIRGRLLRVAEVDGEGFEFLENPALLIEDLRKSRSGIDILTFMQAMPETKPKYAYPMEWDNFAVLPISTFDNWWTKQIDGKTRNMVRRAEKKGLTIREVAFDDALVRGIWELYNECPVRQGRRFPHYGKDIETIGRMSATFLESSVFLGAFSGETLVGFIKLTCNQTRTQAGVMHILSMVQHRDKAPTNALVAQAVKSCAERGIPYLVYSNFSYGKKQTDTLSGFKESNGFQRVDLPRYYVPLTPLGRIGLRMGLHHNFADHVPETLVAKLREYRNSWYNRKAKSLTGLC